MNDPTHDLVERLRRGDSLEAGQVERFLSDFHDRWPGLTEDLLSRWPSRDGPSGHTLLVEAAACDPGDTVVDLATGSGPVARLAAHRVGPEGRVLGVDVSRSELILASRRGRLSHLSYVGARAQQLPLRTASVDVMLCHLALNLFSPVDVAVAEIARVLRPRGTVGAVVFGGSGSCPAFADVRELLDEAVRQALPGFQRTAFGDARAQSEEGLASLFAPKAGFQRFRVQREYELRGHAVPALLAEDLVQFFYVTSALREEERRRLIGRVTEYLEAYTGSDGEATVLVPQRLVIAKAA